MIEYIIVGAVCLAFGFFIGYKMKESKIYFGFYQDIKQDYDNEDI
jgi:hypothetical protein